MTVVDLSAEHEKLYFQCLEDWSQELKDAGSLKEEWYLRMKERGLRVKVALDAQGTVGGIIHYGPIENVPVQGSDLYYLYCIWVHGYKQGRGNFQKQGMGKALLQAAETDARGLGSRGFAVWGLSLPFFMRASWFRKQGYREADHDGSMKLLWKPFHPDAVAPQWVKTRRRPQPQPGKVVVTCLKNGWCPAQNAVYERAKRASEQLGEGVVFQEIDTFEREVGVEWGSSDALFIDGRQVRTGPPPSYEKIRKAIAKRVKRLGR